jgi:hypothetical protein
MRQRPLSFYLLTTALGLSIFYVGTLSRFSQ